MSLQPIYLSGGAAPAAGVGAAAADQTRDPRAMQLMVGRTERATHNVRSNSELACPLPPVVSGPEGVLQSGCIRDLRGTTRALVQMFPDHGRILRREFPIQISIEHFES